MGMASAFKLYTEFATCVVWIIVNNSGDIFKCLTTGQTLLKHYIDDFIGGARTKAKAQSQFDVTKEHWAALGIPANDQKCLPPTRRLEYLGYIFNTPHRILKYNASATAVRIYATQGKKVTNRLLQSLVGQFPLSFPTIP